MAKTIYVLNGLLPGTGPAFAEHYLQPIIGSTSELAEWDMFCQSSGWHGGFALHVDTGMNRLGFRAEEFAAAYSRLSAARGVEQPPRLVTHLAHADDRRDPMTAAQLRRFADATAGRPGERSIANSAGLIAWPEARADWVRPGIALYGVSPFPDRTGAELGLLPAMTFETEIIAVRDVGAGEPVGYGGAWSAPRAARIAVAAVGYGDGYPRSAASGTLVSVAGRPATVAGRSHILVW